MGIVWETNWDEALAKARQAGKPVLLDFFMIDCIGCKEMAANTYRQLQVIEFLSEEFVCLKLIVGENQRKEHELAFRWTPALYVLDESGRPHYHTMGYISPDDFIPHFLLGKLYYWLFKREFINAEQIGQKLISFCPQSFSVPEAMFISAVAGKRGHEDPKLLKRAYLRLEQEYPDSEWFRRAPPYRNIPL